MSNDPSAMLIALAVVFMLGLVLRWVFSPSSPRRGRLPVDAADSPDLGLLTVIASGLERRDALRRRAQLGQAGIRSSMSLRRDGRMDVLVFHADADTARIVLEP